MFVMKSGFRSTSTCSSSASFGWSGNAAGDDLQVLRAHVRKLRVRSFILTIDACYHFGVASIYKCCGCDHAFLSSLLEEEFRQSLPLPVLDFSASVEAHNTSHYWQQTTLNSAHSLLPHRLKHTLHIRTNDNMSAEPENGGGDGDARDPSGFLSEIIGAPVTVKLNSGVVYKGISLETSKLNGMKTDGLPRRTAIRRWLHERRTRRHERIRRWQAQAGLRRRLCSWQQRSALHSAI